MDQPKQEICTIRIIFPVESDEQAFELQKKTKSLFTDTPDVTFEYRIMSGRIPTPRV